MEKRKRAEEVTNNAEFNHTTYLLISEGWLFGEKLAIPVGWILDIYQERTEFAIDAPTLGRVPAYS